MSRVATSSAGFTYIAALAIVVIMGIMLGAVGQTIGTIMKREKEKELLFRGLQIRDAIERWNKKGSMPLLDINHLLKDPRSANGERLLRKLYTDPITGKEWTILKDPNLGIYGVASSSNDKPFKVGDFPEVIKDFEKKEKYSQWEFVYKRTITAATGAPGQTTPTGAPGQAQISFPLYTPEVP